MVEKEINWNLVEEEIAKNKQPRINWKKVFNGKSLTKVIAMLRAEGLDADEIYFELCKTHNFDFEQRRRLKIGIAARFGEMATAEDGKKHHSVII